MPFPAFLLRCLLALVLVAGGVPGTGMAGPAPAKVDDTAMAGCHEAAPALPDADRHDSDHADCCAGEGCGCDCLQHMPVAAIALPGLTVPVFAADVPAPPVFGASGRAPADTLRPPIG